MFRSDRLNHIGLRRNRRPDGSADRRDARRPFREFRNQRLDDLRNRHRRGRLTASDRMMNSAQSLKRLRNRPVRRVAPQQSRPAGRTDLASGKGHHIQFCLLPRNRDFADRLRGIGKKPRFRSVLIEQSAQFNEVLNRARFRIDMMNRQQ